MSFSLLPTMYIPSLTGLTPEKLKQRGVHLLMLDFDNTIVPYTTSVPEPVMDQWLKDMLKSDIKLCVVSNSVNKRVEAFCKPYGLDCITHARKPLPIGIHRCLNRYQIFPENSAIAGDQIFTDTLGGNCAGVQTILVAPIDNHNFLLKARHVLEMPFVIAAKKRSV